MGAIYKREIKAYFTSPIAYIYLAVFYLVTGVYFVFVNLGTATSDLSGVFGGVFTILLVLLPLLTMRLFADEKKMKTDQGLLTAPVSLSGIVLGKFLSAFTVFIIGMLIYIPYILVLKGLAGRIPTASVLGNILGLVLLGASFISIGVFVSSLTEFQIVAAIVSFIINVFMYMIDAFAQNVQWEPLSKAMVAVGFFNRYMEFTQGILNITSVAFFISVIFVFNFLTVRVLERHRWN